MALSFVLFILGYRITVIQGVIMVAELAWLKRMKYNPGLSVSVLMRICCGFSAVWV